VQLFDGGASIVCQRDDRQRDLKTFKQVYVPDPNKQLPVTLFAHGYSYELFGLFEDDRI